MTQHNKSQIQELLDSNPAFIGEAIRMLGANQTADELAHKTTNQHNSIGFSAAHARTGTRLFEFVTGIATKTGKLTWAPKALSHPASARVFRRQLHNHELETAVQLGRKIALVHWRQLGALLSWTPVTTGVTPKKSTARKPQSSVVVQGAEIQTMKGKAVRVLWDSKRVWLPKSQISVNSETGDITMPKWLARNKGMIAPPAADAPTVGGEESDDGFDWDGWNKSRGTMGFQQEPAAKGPQPGTLAHTARMMAAGDDSGFDWDAWKDEMKDRDY
jgi:hypothetical protein|tara:strand:+ start:613 stop:1434 length:822 start_codon:yes stop_codon:yes gene_type:complete